MVQPRYRSRTFRRVYLKTPGGKVKISYRRRKPKKAHCSSCGGLLKGTPRELPYKMKNMAKTKKRPERPYGGKLCSKCMRRLFVERSRATS